MRHTLSAVIALLILAGPCLAQRPVAPTNLAATALSSTQIEVTWTASVTPGVTYNVYSSTISGDENDNPAIATGITGTSFVNTGLAPSTEYWYRVTAVDSGGESNHPTQVHGTTLAGSGGAPSAPSGLSASAVSSSSINLAWTASATSGVTYDVYQGTTSGGESNTPVATGISSTSYAVTGLGASTAYYFKVSAVDSGGTSGLSNEATATTESGSSSIAGRALWIWVMSSVYGNSSEQGSMLSFMAAPKGISANAIKTAFCSGATLANLSDPTVGPEIEAFNTAAHAQGVTVYLLCGDPSWAESQYEQDGLDWVSAALTFNNNCTSTSQKFDGLQYDVEPASDSGWPDATLEAGFLQLFKDSRSLITESGQNFKLSSTIQMVMATTLDSATGEDVDQDVLSQADNVAVMSYRTTVTNLETGADPTVNHAGAVGKKCWAGVETNDVTPASITFYSLGNADMESVFSGALSHFEGESGYNGYCIEDYTGYVALGP